MKFVSFVFSVLCAALLLASCSGKAPVRSGEEFNAERDFNKANTLIESKDYKEARELLFEVRNRDLSKKYSALAQLRIADSYVKEDETDLAVAEYRKFIEMYPDHRHAPYAQYQIAMVYYNQIESPERGYGGAAKALTEFEKLKKDYPRNPYKDVIPVRIEKCRNTIADYEFMVGEFYFRKQAYAAAAERFEHVLKNYPEYKNQERLLLNLGTTYKRAGNQQKSHETLKLLLEKYPNSPLAQAASKELTSPQSGSK